MVHDGLYSPEMNQLSVKVMTSGLVLHDIQVSTRMFREGMKETTHTIKMFL
jgi:hypothetical protein